MRAGAESFSKLWRQLCSPGREPWVKTRVDGVEAALRRAKLLITNAALKGASTPYGLRQPANSLYSGNL